MPLHHNSFNMAIEGISSKNLGKLTLCVLDGILRGRRQNFPRAGRKRPGTKRPGFECLKAVLSVKIVEIRLCGVLVHPVDCSTDVTCEHTQLTLMILCVLPSDLIQQLVTFSLT